MEKKCKIVLLPTWISNIYKSKEGKLYYWASPDLETSIAQHLYIISDDNIKVGDWIYDSYDLIVYQILQFTSRNPHQKKIIATTDLVLIKEGIASIDDEFIKQYCNNPVEEVLVEYEANMSNNPYSNSTYEGIKHSIALKLLKESSGLDIKPKLSSNGFIIIKPVEETWDDIFKEVENSFRHDFHISIEVQQRLKENYEVPKKNRYETFNNCNIIYILVFININYDR